MRSEKTKQLLSLIAYGCFLAGIVIETLLVVVDKSAYTIPAEGQIFRLTFVLFLVKVLLTRYTKREYAAIFLFCILGGLSYFATGRNEVLRLVIMIAACKDMDMRRTFKLIFGITLSGCALIMFLALTGIYGTVSLTQEYGRGVTETRYTLGMGHPNALHCMVFCLILLGIYLYGRSMKWFHYLFLILVNYGFFRLTGSRTSFLITTATILYAMLLLYLKQEALKKLLIFGGYLAAACSVLLSVVIAGNAYRVYDYVWNADRTPVTMIFVKLNELFNGRIRILVENDGFEGTMGTWSLFSRPENNYFFDMGWIRLFYWFGIIPAVVFLAALLWLMVCCYQKKDYMGIVMIVAIFVYHIIEAHMISDYLGRNYLYFLLGAYFSRMLSGKERQGHEGT